MDKKKKHLKKKDESKIATGIDDDEELSARASEEEIEKGEYTRVIRLTEDADMYPE
ncbi:hypothetical protein [Scopulibacillus cellulosilyticus]|uniref:YfhD-like protein n=1 Tax=Scopulibacillus cellulosilyticus TaxID=2665665 RepID=A0ABW2PTM6_9BACL